jgi:hypothetical protein
MIAQAYHTASRAYIYHGELIKQAYTLSLTSCVLAGKIWTAMPPLAPNLSLLLLRYTGICFIGPQVNHLCKSFYDFRLAFHYSDYQGMCQTAAKVGVKATNLFLTIAQFAVPIIALLANPAVSVEFAAALVPISRAAWAIGCGNEICDYYLNHSLLDELKALEHHDTQKKQIVESFLGMLGENALDAKQKESSLALRLVRQCEGSTLDLFTNAIDAKQTPVTNELSQRQFSVLCDSLDQKNHYGEAGTVLSGLGYGAMHISKLYPDGIVEWSLRWSISFLYLLKSIHKKMFNAEQQDKLTSE